MSSKIKIKKTLILFLLLLTSFPNLLLSQVNSATSIEIIQEENVLDIKITVPQDIYISDETLDVSIVSESVSLVSIFYQDPEEFEGRDIYFKNANIKAIVGGKADDGFEVLVAYQTCSKKHECSETLSFKKMFKMIKQSKREEKVEKTLETQTLSEDITEQDSIAKMLDEKSIVLILLTFFGFGLLLSFTPCMLPVIPILSAVIISKSKNMNTRRGFFLSLTYVLSMSIVYAIAGVVAASLGSNVQAFFQQTWIIVLVSLFFFILSMAMFGTFNIEMPKRIQSFLTVKSASTKRQSYLSVVFLGILSALIIGPCVAPPLAGALIYISQTGNELIGGLSLFVMSLGMGVPLLILGAGAGKFLPKPGPWMESVKLIFGFVMLGFSLWILSRILEEQVIMFLWGILLTGISLFMNIFEVKNISDSTLLFKFKKLFAFLFLIFGLVLIVGSIGGAKNILNPLEPFTSKTVNSAQPSDLLFEYIEATEIESVVERSSAPVMIFFTASWCDNCKELEKNVFSKADVAESLLGFSKYKIDVTANTLSERKLLKKYALFGPPGIIFFDKQNRELPSKRLIGYKDKKLFLEHIESVKNLIR